MTIFSDLFCGCTFPSVARANNTVIDGAAAEPIAPAVSSRALPGGRHRLRVPARLYEPDIFDPIDSQLSVQLASLDRTAASQLTLQRIGPGEYDLDGRRVSLRWGASTLRAKPELLVQEQGDSDDSDEGEQEIPLATYLREAADVASFLGGRNSNVPPVTRVPQANRLTFCDALGPLAPEDRCGDERVQSMKVACKQALLREQAAEAYERAELIPKIATMGGVQGSSVPSMLPPVRRLPSNPPGVLPAAPTAVAMQVPPAARSATPSRSPREDPELPSLQEARLARRLRHTPPWRACTCR